jgi:hypothetical protein
LKAVAVSPRERQNISIDFLKLDVPRSLFGRVETQVRFGSPAAQQIAEMQLPVREPDLITTK